MLYVSLFVSMNNSPMSSLFLMSRAMFLSAVATAQTTLSLSILSNSTRIGRPFSLRTAARIYTDHWAGERVRGGLSTMLLMTAFQYRLCGCYAIVLFGKFKLWPDDCAVDVSQWESWLAGGAWETVLGSPNHGDASSGEHETTTFHSNAFNIELSQPRPRCWTGWYTDIAI